MAYWSYRPVKCKISKTDYGFEVWRKVDLRYDIWYYVRTLESFEDAYCFALDSYYLV